MVGVVAVQVVDVQRDTRVVREALEELVGQLRVEGADHAALEVDAHVQPRATREVDHHARQRLVERHVGVAVAAQPLLVAHRLRDRLAERDADVFDRVVAVDVQIAVARDVEVDQPVAGDLVEHVVEEADAGGKLGSPRAVKVQGHTDLRLVGVADYVGSAVHDRFAFIASIIRSFSSGVPTVRRRQFSSRGCILETFFTRTLRAFIASKSPAASGTRVRIMLASLG